MSDETTTETYDRQEALDRAAVATMSLRMGEDVDECRCGGDGMIETRDGGTYYPCKEHNAGAFWRWVRGHFGPEHDELCAECALVRRGKQPKASRGAA